MKAKYYEEDNLLQIMGSAPSKDGSTLLEEWLVSISFPDSESRVIVGLEVVQASYFFVNGYSPDADTWTLGDVKGADLVEEHGDFIGYWQRYRFDDGNVELSPIGVELRQASKHIPHAVRKALRRRQREYENVGS